MRISGPPSAQVVLLLQRRDESLSPDLIEQGRVDVILDLGADAMSLSAPKLLTATTPPLRSVAVLTPEAEKKVSRIMLPSEPMSRRSPPA